MSKVAEALNSMRKNPFIAIEFILGFALIVYGGILLSPYYEATPSSVISLMPDAPLLGTLVAVLYIITGLIALFGAYRPTVRNRSISTWFLFSAFLFTTLIRLLTAGFFPLLWIWTLLLALVAIIDNWNLTWKPS